MKRRTWLILATTFFAILALLMVGTEAQASLPSGLAQTSQSSNNGSKPTDQGKPVQSSDGLEQLPNGLQAVSYSTLLNQGKVHPVDSNLQVDSTAHYNNPLSVVTWGPETSASGNTDANEPSANMHPTDPLYALVSGNFPIDNTSNGGVSWQNRPAANPSGNGDVVNVWLPTSPNQDYAYNASLNTAHGANITSGRSTDRGATWANFPSNIDTASFFNDREYLWTDQEPSSPFYGRIYLTGTFFDTAGSGSFNTTFTRFSSDGGAVWSAPFLQDSTAPIAGTQGNRQFASIGFGVNGTVNVGWMDARCCGANPTIGGDFNKYKWSRSTDGGATFPFSGTAAIDTAARSVPFNSNSPAGFRWSPQSNMAADPVDGTMYMVWLARRTDNTNTGVGVYTTHSTNGGGTWTAPMLVYNDPSATVTQYFPWATVSRDHVLHVTFTSSVGASQTTLAHFYTQSTDQGNTFSTPFQLSTVTYTPSSFMGDYQAVHAGAYNGGNGAIVASWTDNRSNLRRHYARIGTFIIGTPTATVTGTPPTATRTSTPSNTATASATSCGSNGNYTIATATAGALIPGTTNTGNSCDDCTTTITLPFPVTVYGQTFTTADVSSNGQIDFGPADSSFTNTCLPDSATTFAVFPYWDDQRTDTAGSGIFTAVVGNQFVIEWRTTLFSGGTPENYEIVFTQGTPNFVIKYGPQITDTGSETIGVQKDATTGFTQYKCNTTGGAVTPGLQLNFTLPSCATGTSTVTGTPPTATRTTTGTAQATTTCAPSGGGTWTDMLPVPALRGRALGVTSGTDVYVFGGRPDNTTFAQTVYRYSTTANTWTLLTQQVPDTFTSNMSGGVLNFPEGPRVFIAGGSGPSSAVSGRTFAFNPADGSFTPKAAWPQSPLVIPGGWAVANNKFYIFGGFDPAATAMISTIWMYDPTTNVWTQLAPTLSVARGYIATELMPDGMIYLAGGFTGTGTTFFDSTTFEKFNPTNNTIVAGPPLPTAKSNNQGYNVNGKFIVPLGGFEAANHTTTVYIFDPATNTWSTTTSALHTTRNYAKGYGANGTIYAIGGLDPGATAFYDYNQRFTPGSSGCSTATVTQTTQATSTRTSTAVASNTTTAVATGTSTAVASNTASPTAQTTSTSIPTAVTTATTVPATACPIQFQDVPPSNTFYQYVRCLACRNILGGYQCGGPGEPCGTTGNPYFRYGANITRGQIAKIVSQSAGFTEPPGTQVYEDVPTGSPFYDYVQRLTNRGYIGGYPCGQVPTETCVGPANRPYFRPQNPATRGQISKIVATAAMITDPVSGQIYTDVGTDSPFYRWIQQLSSRGVMSGYPCGGPGEPCDAQNRPYFRPNANVTRGQASKIVANTFFPNCQTPANPTQASPNQ